MARRKRRRRRRPQNTKHETSGTWEFANREAAVDFIWINYVEIELVSDQLAIGLEMGKAW